LSWPSSSSCGTGGGLTMPCWAAWTVSAGITISSGIPMPGDPRHGDVPLGFDAPQFSVVQPRNSSSADACT
jgi:hypothetical protein